MNKRILAIVCLVFIVLLVAACEPMYPPVTPQRDFTSRGLVLDATDTPSGWDVDEAGPRPPGQAPLGHRGHGAGISFYAEGARALQEVSHHDSVWGASREFDRQLRLHFPSGRRWMPWSVPSELTYQIPAAHRFLYGCAYNGGQRWCCAMWQYEERIVQLSIIYMRDWPDAAAYAALEDFMTAIDERMMAYLNLSPSESPVTPMPFDTPTPPPERDTPTSRRLIDVSMFPQGWPWYENGPTLGLSLYWWSVDGAATEIWFEEQYPHLFAEHEVYLYNTEQEAADVFHRWNVELSDTCDYLEAPPELPYHSSVADQFCFGCGEGGCRAVGQYGRFYSNLYVWVDLDLMTYEDVERILQAVDERMALPLNDE